MVRSQCSACIHDGHSALIGWTLCNGLPSLMLCRDESQVFWGKHLSRVGVSPLRVLYASDLLDLPKPEVKEVLTNLLSVDLRSKCRTIAPVLCADGLVRSVSMINEHCLQSEPPKFVQQTLPYWSRQVIKIGTFLTLSIGVSLLIGKLAFVDDQ